MIGARKRGRPRKVRPVFRDADAERRRVERCAKDGRDPYPAFKHKPCKAERELRKCVKPGVPFDLVLALNDTDDDGFTACEIAAATLWDKAAAKRKAKAREGGEMRQRTNLAAEIVGSESEYIREKHAKGWSKSRIINGIKNRRVQRGKTTAGRSEMYKQLGRLMSFL